MIFILYYISSYYKQKRGPEGPLNYRNCIKSILDYRARPDTVNFS